MTPWTNEHIAANGEPVRENFSRWFGKSQAVDGSGNPAILYHGTSADAFNAFDAVNGAHFGSREQAVDRIGDPDVDLSASHGPRLIAVFLAIENPMRACDQGSEWEDVIDEAKHLGHDGIVYLNRGEGLGDAPDEDAIADAQTDAEFLRAAPAARDSWIAFRPDQIKRVDNCGLFLVGSADLTDSLANDALEAASRARSVVEINAMAPKSAQPPGVKP